jgi:hypothetical protein
LVANWPSSSTDKTPRQFLVDSTAKPFIHPNGKAELIIDHPINDNNPWPIAPDTKLILNPYEFVVLLVGVAPE